MTNNPFDGLGGQDGGLDMNSLLQQAQQMQEQLVSAQEQLAEETVQGSVASGAVTVTLTGTGELAGVAITPGTVDGSDQEDLDNLSDLVVAAYRDAKTRADTLAAERLGPLAGGTGGGGADPLGPGSGSGPSGSLGF